MCLESILERFQNMYENEEEQGVVLSTECLFVQDLYRIVTVNTTAVDLN